MQSLTLWIASDRFKKNADILTKSHKCCGYSVDNVIAFSLYSFITVTHSCVVLKLAVEANEMHDEVNKNRINPNFKAAFIF